jgi:mono/diheme cytochrome c family protein
MAQLARYRVLLLASAALASVAIVPGKGFAQAPAGAPADPAAGRALFVGARRFQAGGPPCGVCHGVAGQGPGVSASYGPDLSAAGDAYGADTIASLLADMPFPSMAPAYEGRPLEPAERAEVAAFLVAAGGRAPAGESGWFAAEAGGVFAVLLAAVALAGRGRRGSARARLLAKATEVEP